mgnify:FL=1
MTMEYVQPIRDRKKIEAMKHYLKGKSIRDYLLFVMGISSALRVSDICTIRLKQIWNGKSVPDFISLREQKTGKAKLFPISKNLEKAIHEYIKYYNPSNPDEFVFKSRKGTNTPITRIRAFQIIKDAAKAVGIKDNIGTHSMRKTFGYWAYKEGYDISLLSEAFGHSSEQVTRRYIGITQDDVSEIYINLNL